MTKIPGTVRAENASARYDATMSPIYRELFTGDTLGIPFDLSDNALKLIPPGAKYLILGPSDEETAQTAYGMNAITYETFFPWLRYLLLPARPAVQGKARWVICWGCDTSPYDGHTDWLWTNGNGAVIGRVK
jgi:hypothetical protein